MFFNSELSLIGTAQTGINDLSSTSLNIDKKNNVKVIRTPKAINKIKNNVNSICKELDKKLIDITI